MTKREPLVVIENFQRGIADSPHLGFADMRNLSIHSKPGVATLNFLMQMTTPAPVSTTFTSVAATDISTLAAGTMRWNGHGATKRAVILSSSGTLPAGLSPATVYYVIDVTSTTFKLATTRLNADAGTAINITDTGTGTHTLTTVDLGLVKFFTNDSRTTTLYAQDSNGRIWDNNGGDWYLLTGNTLTNANAQGLAVYKNYLFVFRSAKIDVYGSLTAAEASRSWTNDWQSLNSGVGSTYTHTALVTQDDILRFADFDTTSGTPYIGKVEAIGTFDPGTPSTYSYNNQELDLPAYKIITCLEELGENLMIGTVGREIYPWDREADSYDRPILAGEDGISVMRTLNNILYFSAGVRGNIYSTLGSSTTLERRMPVSITNIPYNGVTISAMIGHKGRLFFTVGVIGASGLYSMDVITKVINLESRITTAPIDAGTNTGTYGVSSAVLFGALYSAGSESIHISWKDVDNTLYGINNTIYNNYYFYPSYAGYLESELIPVGNALNRKSANSILVEMAKLLTAGQGVRVSWRKNLTDSYSTPITFDYTTYSSGNVLSFAADLPIAEADFIQVKVELTVSTSSQTAPELRSVIVL